MRIVIGVLGIITNGLVKELEDYRMIKIDRNTEKSPADLRRLVVPQTPVKDHPLMQSLCSTGLNSEFSFSLISCLTKAKEPSLSNDLHVNGER